ncbi:winged helix DNA-binding domain-containing protein [Tahibacter soli]|uniref:Winged helix DNA-binding domain-containing protein n=1 Tax=Tahibacter soli TaxID=2983605 RepID=A0A9X3YRZ1_9GAMM|nr:winged helix DNA-binding domain-containing protein [Tahibacter soli]MDC8016038.1 winged helix DNA-binding domain-containing protein [Tahibacter soli]
MARNRQDTARTLTARELNRATLARQWLIGRANATPLAAIEHLAGLQAQAPNPPYYQLWTRLADFRRDDLTALIEERRVVRAACQRSTLHLVGARDFLGLRGLVDAVLERGLQGGHGRFLTGLDLDEIAKAGDALLRRGALSNAELGAKLAERWTGRDETSLAAVLRCRRALVHVPPAGTWNHNKSALLAPAERWLDAPLDGRATIDAWVPRYLAAFGPASVKDMQTWSGLTGLAAAFERQRDALVTFRDENGVELFDLPDAPRPDAGTPVPTQFLAEFDNLLLSHADRTRVVATEHQKKVMTINGLVRGAILVDGFVQGIWRIERGKRAATLSVEPFATLAKKDRDALADEGRRLLAFAADEVDAHTVAFAKTA